MDSTRKTICNMTSTGYEISSKTRLAKHHRKDILMHGINIVSVKKSKAFRRWVQQSYWVGLNTRVKEKEIESTELYLSQLIKMALIKGFTHIFEETKCFQVDLDALN